MSEMPWVKFYPGDWLDGTAALTAAERGVYITIVALIYEFGGPVPLDRTRLARRCGVPAGSFKRLVEALIQQGKLFETPDGIFNERCRAVLEERFGRAKTKGLHASDLEAIQAEKANGKQGPSPENATSLSRERARAVAQDLQIIRDTLDASASNDLTVVSAAPEKVVDFTKAIFDRGVAYLARYGMQERQARSLVGKWRSKHGEEAVFAAFADANRNGVTEPVAYITRILEKTRDPPGNVQPDLDALFAAIPTEKKK